MVLKRYAQYLNDSLFKILGRSSGFCLRYGIPFQLVKLIMVEFITKIKTFNYDIATNCKLTNIFFLALIVNLK